MDKHDVAGIGKAAGLDFLDQTVERLTSINGIQDDTFGSGDAGNGLKNG